MMENLFDKNLLQNIIGGVVVLLISILLGSRSKTRTSSDKKWKVVAIIAWAMIIAGTYIFLTNLVKNGNFHNPYIGLGVTMLILGAILEIIAKFFIWWHR